MKKLPAPGAQRYLQSLSSEWQTAEQVRAHALVLFGNGFDMCDVSDILDRLSRNLVVERRVRLMEESEPGFVIGKQVIEYRLSKDLRAAQERKQQQSPTQTVSRTVSIRPRSLFSRLFFSP